MINLIVEVVLNEGNGAHDGATDVCLLSGKGQKHGQLDPEDLRKEVPRHHPGPTGPE